MSFGFRKSFSSGPFRVSISKGGVSTSFGLGGARITSGPRGTYASLSKGGFYYRQRIDRHTRSPSSSNFLSPGRVETAPPPDGPIAPSARPETSPPPEIFGDIAADQVVAAINRRTSRRDYSIPAGIAVCAVLGMLSAPWQVVTVVCVTVVGLLHLHHRASRYSELHYDEDQETLTKLEGLQKAITSLRSCDSVWAVREANLTLGLTPLPATLARTVVATGPARLPKSLRTNISPAALQLSDAALFFFPDRLFLWHSDRFRSIPYSSIKIRFSRARFLERQRQPADAALESSFRLSLGDEARVPIVWYGMIEFDAAPAVQMRLMTSRVEAAQEFIDQLCNAAEFVEPEQKEQTAPPFYTHFDSHKMPLFYELSEKQRRSCKPCAMALRFSFSASTCGDTKTSSMARTGSVTQGHILSSPGRE